MPSLSKKENRNSYRQRILKEIGEWLENSNEDDERVLNKRHRIMLKEWLFERLDFLDIGFKHNISKQRANAIVQLSIQRCRLIIMKEENTRLISESVNNSGIEHLNTETEETVLTRPLYKFDLSVRVLNALKFSDIATIQDLLNVKRSDLLKARNFGKKSLQEMDLFLSRLNIVWDKN